MDLSNIVDKAGGVAADATVDTGADGFINTAIDDVAGHIPGGSAIDAVAKTGIDLAANNAINGELGSRRHVRTQGRVASVPFLGLPARATPEA